MGKRFTIGHNDLAPKLDAVITSDDTGLPQDLTACTVTFYMSPVGSTTPTINGGAVTVTDAPNGKVEYAWVLGDTAATGEFLGEFLVILPSGAPQTCPNKPEKKAQITVEPRVTG